MNLPLLAGSIVALAKAQHTVLWVPECGDEVLMLGTHAASEFKSANTLSVTDIDSILAFRTYTVISEKLAPSGFQYVGEYLVKTPPSRHTVTTCTTSLAGTQAAKSAYFPSENLMPTNTQPQTSAQSQTSVTPTPVSSCFTSGQPLTESVSVMNIIFSFCGLHPNINTPTSISSTMTHSDVPMLLEVSPTGCSSESTTSGTMPVRFGKPDDSNSTDSIKTYNKALYPCVKLYEIWEYCKLCLMLDNSDPSLTGQRQR